MKIFSTTHFYSYNWSQVTVANWLKYPNPNSTHVLHVDILDRSLDPTTGILRTERLIACRQPIPSLIRLLLGVSDLSYAREVSEVDPHGRVSTAITRNLSLRDVMTVEERCVYREDPERPEAQTLFTQEARITALGAVSRFAGRVEDFALGRFRDNAAIGRRGLEWVLERLGRESTAVSAMA